MSPGPGVWWKYDSARHNNFFSRQLISPCKVYLLFIYSATPTCPLCIVILHIWWAEVIVVRLLNCFFSLSPLSHFPSLLLRLSFSVANIVSSPAVYGVISFTYTATLANCPILTVCKTLFACLPNCLLSLPKKEIASKSVYEKIKRHCNAN